MEVYIDLTIDDALLTKMAKAMCKADESAEGDWNELRSIQHDHYRTMVEAAIEVLQDSLEHLKT